MTDPHLAARAADVRDIEARILGQLIGQRPQPLQDELPSPRWRWPTTCRRARRPRLDPSGCSASPPRPAAAPATRRSWPRRWRSRRWSGWGQFLELSRQCRMAIIDGDEGLVILDPDHADASSATAQAAAERSARFDVLSRAGRPARRDARRHPGGGCGATSSSPTRSTPA